MALNLHPQIGLFFEYGLLNIVQRLDNFFIHSDNLIFGDKSSNRADYESQPSKIYYDKRENELEKLGLRSKDPLSFPDIESTWDPMAKLLFQQKFSTKTQLEFIGDKTPAFLDNKDYLSLMERLENLRIIIILRNPLDVVISSIERRNLTRLNLDQWHIHSIQEAVSEWITVNKGFFKLSHSFQDRILFVKYEDSFSHPSNFYLKIEQFLNLESPIPTYFRHSNIPSDVRAGILTEAENKFLNSKLGSIINEWENADIQKIKGFFDELHITYSLGSLFDFGTIENKHCMISGFSTPEEFGCWTDGAKANFKFKINGPFENLKLTITYRSFNHKDVTIESSANIFINGYLVGKLLNQGWTRSSQDFCIPQGIVPSSGKFELKIEMIRPKLPTEEPQTDSRELGVFFESLFLCET